MSAISPRLRDKLGRLFPRLASDNDHERLATVAAIITTLKGEGCDLHDLAGAIAPGLTVPTAAASGTISPAPDFSGLSHFERRAWLDAILICEWLTAFERDRIKETRNLVITGIGHRLHWRKLKTVNAVLARAHALGVRA